MRSADYTSGSDVGHFIGGIKVSRPRGVPCLQSADLHDEGLGSQRLYPDTEFFFADLDASVRFEAGESGGVQVLVRVGGEQVTGHRVRRIGHGARPRRTCVGWPLGDSLLTVC